jgi:hypothetical protein
MIAQLLTAVETYRRWRAWKRNRRIALGMALLMSAERPQPKLTVSCYLIDGI